MDQNQSGSDNENELFISQVAHDLRLSLGTFNILIDLVKPDNLSSELSEYWRIINEEYLHQIQIVDKLLDYCRSRWIDRGRINGKIDLNILVEHIVGLYKIHAKKKNINLIINKAQHLPILFGDEFHFRQIITNLLDNAFKYTAEGGEVRAAFLMQNGGISIIIQDSGIGIPAGEMERIFQPCYRASNVDHGHTPGYGIGLYVTYNLVRDLGGSIQVSNAGDKGSIFQVWLPFLENDAS